ncbi:MAG: hypothetical protein RI907_626 [Pseudomonadota bacterium]
MTISPRLPLLSLALVAATLSGCAYLSGTTEPEAAPAQAVAQAKAEAAQAPSVKAGAAKAEAAPAAAAAQATAGEAALAEGLKAYQAGQYKQAETQLTAAVKAGLTAPADLVAAQKHLAFIYCTSKRDSMCAAAFKAAKAADPSFALSKAEAGHPMWAKTYKRAMGLK